MLKLPEARKPEKEGKAREDDREGKGRSREQTWRGKTGDAWNRLGGFSTLFLLLPHLRSQVWAETPRPSNLSTGWQASPSTPQFLEAMSRWWATQ